MNFTEVLGPFSASEGALRHHISRCDVPRDAQLGVRGGSQIPRCAARRYAKVAVTMYC